MKPILLVFFIGFSTIVFSQNRKIEVFKGVLVCDSLKVERATITNTTLETNTISDDLGFFSIYAREGDTIVISSVTFDTERIVLKATDFKELISVIHLTVNVNLLDEVKVGAFKLSGNLVYDAKRIKVKPPIKADLSSIDFKNLEITGVKTTANLAMPQEADVNLGVNFIKLGKSIFQLFNSDDEFSKPKPIKTYNSHEFVTEMKQRFTPDFYQKTLNVEEDKISLFLEYCFSEEINQKQLLERINSLQLIDFLVGKSIAFHKE
jgi:hypothetical protein